jgi:hypothetical protein
MYRKEPVDLVLRMLCLKSVAEGGIKEKDLESICKEFLQVCGALPLQSCVIVRAASRCLTLGCFAVRNLAVLRLPLPVHSVQLEQDGIPQSTGHLIDQVLCRIAKAPQARRAVWKRRIANGLFICLQSVRGDSVIQHHSTLDN